MPFDESELIRRVRNGDPAAFERLVRQFDARILNLAYRLTADAEEARDVRQQVFLRMLPGLERFNGRSRLETWLYRVAVNICRDRVRSREASRGREKSLLRNGPSGRDDDGTPPLLLEQEEATERVRTAVRELPQDEREVLVLRHYQDLQFKTIGELLELPVTTVRSRMLRALERLRKRLAGSSLESS